MRTSKKILLLIAAAASLQTEAQTYSPWLQAVDEYVPAPGQFVNVIPPATADDTPQTMAAKCTSRIAGEPQLDKPTTGLISLGSWGGYVVFHFDHPVANVPGEKDFVVYGNAFENNAEPGIVMVAVDENGNGLPDDQWFELYGSEHDNPLTRHNYSVTYRQNPFEAIPWEDSEGEKGEVPVNMYHQQEFFPLWLSGSDELTFTGTRLPDNMHFTGEIYVMPAYEWGYADNLPNDSTDGCAMNIEWARDADGNPAALSHADFIKVYSATLQADDAMTGIGEISTEVKGAADLHLEASVEAMAVRTVKTDADGRQAVFTLSGIRAAKGFRGLAIRRMEDGSVRKTVMKQ